MEPYFKDVLNLFKEYLTASSEENEEVKKLQIAALGKIQNKQEVKLQRTDSGTKDTGGFSTNKY